MKCETNQGERSLTRTQTPPIFLLVLLGQVSLLSGLTNLFHDASVFLDLPTHEVQKGLGRPCGRPTLGASQRRVQPPEMPEAALALPLLS